MALRGKKSSQRKEPQFGLGASLASLRLNIADRISIAGDDKSKVKKPAKRETSSSGSGNSRKPRKRGARGGLRHKLYRGVYWGAVLGLWGVIAVVGVVIWVGAHLPPIQSLEIPKRPPTIQIVGLDGSVLATRGEMGGASVALKELPAYLP